jgi:hypothetical protein
MPKIRLEEGIEHQALGQSENVAWQEAIENDLPLSKWAGEEKFDVGWFENESALQESFEERATDHQQGTPNQAFGPN